MRNTIATMNMLNNAGNVVERLPAIAAELARVQPTVFCAQEVLHSGSNGVRPDLLALFADHELTMAVAGRAVGSRAENQCGNAILYRASEVYPIETGLIEFGSTAQPTVVTRDAAYAVLRAVDDESALPLIVISAHLAWGAEAGAERLAAVVRIESFAAALTERHPGALCLFVGDFNETPGAAAIKYLLGDSAAVPGVFWVDAWSWLRPGEIGHTQDPQTKYAAQTAATVGIADSSTLPKRRLDYVMIRGWAYAKLGPSPSIELWGHGDHGYASDHHGLALSFDR